MFVFNDAGAKRLHKDSAMSLCFASEKQPVAGAAAVYEVPDARNHFTITHTFFYFLHAFSNSHRNMNLSEESTNQAPPPPYPTKAPAPASPQRPLSPVMEKGESKVQLDSCAQNTPVQTPTVAAPPPITVQPQPNGE